MTLAITHLKRRFADFIALDDVSLSIAPGEFVALLGPSGSGKTTLLRILAGLESADAGQVLRDGNDLLALDARKRKVGMVFQHYALFRHLSVRDNVAFGLRVRPRRMRPGRAEIQTRVQALLKRVQLDGFADRYPSQLSGGQRQRVALARALAVEPELLLLDEPFGALDAQVRVTLRRWLRHLHEELELTTVFVTHDQEEALELADRVVVMNHGRIEQVGTPEAIYQQPTTPFVCEFIGKANRVALERRRGALFAGTLRLGDDPWSNPAEGAAVGYVRPEHLALSSQTQDEGWMARLEHIYLSGSVAHLELAVEGPVGTLEAVIGADELQRRGLKAGMRLCLQPRQLTAFALSPATGEADPGQHRLLRPQFGPAGVARLR